MDWKGFALGLAAGLVIAALTKAVESSRLAIGPYAFYGNGALIVPAIGGALAIYALWAWQLRTGERHRVIALSALGLVLGVGAMAYPSVPGMLLNGLLFVGPTALGTYAVYRLGAASPAPLLAVLVVVGALLSVVLQMIVLGLVVGPFLIAGARARSGLSTALLGIALAGVLMAASLILPLLMLSRSGPR